MIQKIFFLGKQTLYYMPTLCNCLNFLNEFVVRHLLHVLLFQYNNYFKYSLQNFEQSLVSILSYLPFTKEKNSFFNIG